MADGGQVGRAWDRAELASMFDPATGLLDRRMLSDESIYRLELERIFARGWNFMCHESQLPNPGDYFINYIGEDQVIVVRDDEGEVNVLLNTCRHRGNALCRAEQGQMWTKGTEERRRHPAHPAKFVDAFQRRCRRAVVEPGGTILRQQLVGLAMTLSRSDPFGNRGGEIRCLVRCAPDLTQEPFEQRRRGEAWIDAPGFIVNA